MQLDYLDFDYSEDDEGNATWDAMASVPAARWPALLQEVSSVLRWACADYPGRWGALDEGASWDWDLSAQDDDHGSALKMHWDAPNLALHAAAPQAGGYGTLTLTLSGTADFSHALRHTFELE